MDDIDQLLEDLRNAALNKHSNLFQQPQQQNHTIKRLNSNESNSEIIAINNDNNNKTNKTTSVSSISELDNLLNDLNNAKKIQIINNINNNETNYSTESNRSSISPASHFNKTQNTNRNFTSRKSLEKLIDALDNEFKISRKNSNNIEPEAAVATKELEDLMNSLSSFKVESNLNENKKSMISPVTINNLCNQCGEAITGQVITALGSLWHPSHFTCFYCNNAIGTSLFYEKDGRPYCENDYLNLFSPKCAKCLQPILDKMLTALNKTWHPNCFTCLSCSKLLNDESFLEKNNNAYCKDCYVSKLAPKCLHCNKSIVDNFISAMNSYWHENCFVCTECGIPFNHNSFYEYNGLPYCEIHYHHKRGSLCSNCQQPINGRCITAMNKKFHPEHFICSFCTKQLNKGTFKEQNDKPYCHTCFFKLFPQ